MSAACKDGACEVPRQDEKGTERKVCPRCGEQGKSVDLMTVKSLLKSEALKQIDPNDAYWFCVTRDCEVVYYHAKSCFMKGDLTVRVYQKETDDPLPVCYCFGFTREKIQREVARTGKSTASQEISQYVKEGKCACELRNPQGSCCLGNVALVVKQVQSEKMNVTIKNEEREG